MDPRADADAQRGLPLSGWRRRILEPLARSQRAFNDAVLKIGDGLSERIDGVAGALANADRRVREIDERLIRLERRGSSEVPRTVAAQPRQNALPDYFAFETRMRAPTDEVRERQRPYVELLAKHPPVLDVGCGRGELLALLRDAGVEASGVDADADMVAFARGEKLDVALGDVLAYLGQIDDESLGAITALQLVEHLPPAALVTLLESAARKLRPGGMLLLETINPSSVEALRNYFADLTHAQPLVPETLSLLVSGAGFSSVETLFLNEPGEKLQDVALPAGEEWDGARATLAANTRKLNEALYAPLDYAVIAYRS